MIWTVIWVVLMMFWLFGYGAYAWNQPTPSLPAFGVNCLIPWACVLILGLVLFGAVTLRT